MNQTQEYMLIFRFEPNSDYQPTAEEQEAQATAWGKFIGGIALQEKLVNVQQLGFDGHLIEADSTVAPNLYKANNEVTGGNMVIKAASIEEAIELGKGCPILSAGGSVEVRNVIPMNN